MKNTFVFLLGRFWWKTTFWSLFHRSHLSHVSRPPCRCLSLKSLYSISLLFLADRANIRCYFGLRTAVEEMIVSCEGESHFLLNVCKCARERSAKSAGEVTGQEWGEGEGGIFNSWGPGGAGQCTLLELERAERERTRAERGAGQREPQRPCGEWPYSKQGEVEAPAWRVSSWVHVHVQISRFINQTGPQDRSLVISQTWLIHVANLW